MNNNVGWKCPVCGRVNAPWISVCFCSQKEKKRLLETEPTSEIVYCSECKYLSSYGICDEFADSSIFPSASDYCSKGVKKDGSID